MTKNHHAPRRVLITGAGGSIGRQTTDMLLNEGMTVTALSREFERPCRADRVIVGDAADVDTLRHALLEVDAVVHLAARPSPTAGTPYEIFRDNVSCTFNVLHQSGAHGIQRVVIASSINAFGIPMNPLQALPAYWPLDENSPVNIGDPYSLSKHTDETTAQMAANAWGLDVAALRFPLVKDFATLRASRTALRTDPSLMVREGWAYLDIRDAARAVLAGLDAHFCGAHVISLSAEDTLLGGLTSDLVRRYAPSVPCRTSLHGHRSLVDTSRSETLLGFHARYSVHRDEDAFDHPVAAANGGVEY